MANISYWHIWRFEQGIISYSVTVNLIIKEKENIMFKKCIKKLLCIVLSSVMIMSMSVTVSATKNPESTHKTVEINGYIFEITEQIDASNRTIRYYENNSLNPRATADLNKTKALLIAMGMQEKNVNNMSIETLQEFAASQEIYIATSYSKTDKHNNVTYLDESTALQEAAALKEQQDILKANLLQGLTTAADYSDSTEDSYMRVDFAVTYQGDGSYLYSVDGEWLTMPFFRGFDSIGACAMNGTITNSTRSGSYHYDVTYIIDGQVIYNNYNGTITNMQNTVNGNWYGSAGVFKLPNDFYGDSTIIYDNFSAHYQYSGHVSSPSEEHWFNTVGTYDHATLALAFNPTVSINLKGDVSASIGLKLLGDSDSRSVEFEVHYTP